jgi:large subunit ribosomal protein L27
MAHTKAKGTSKLGRDSASKRLGVKKYAGETVACGNIIIRQRGTKFHAGDGTKQTGDDTVIAMKEGKVAFEKKTVVAFTGRTKKRTFVKVV